MTFLENILERAQAAKKSIVFPEGREPRILKAVSHLHAKGILEPVLLGEPDKIQDIAGKENIAIQGISIVNPLKSEHRESFAEEYHALRKHKGVTLEDARDTMKDEIYFGTMMVRKGIVDGYLAGAVTTTAKTVQAGLRILKTKPGVKKMSSFFFMILDEKQWGADGVLIMADAAIIIDMDAETMAEIAMMTAENAESIAGITPRIAMLSYSTLGSGTGERVEMVREATRIVREKRPELLVDGELQADAAIVPSVGALKAPGSAVAGRANILIFPSIEAANISYKLVQRLAHAKAVGPILQGLSKPANDLSRGCSVEDVIYTAAITALQCR